MKATVIATGRSDDGQLWVQLRDAANDVVAKVDGGATYNFFTDNLGNEVSVSLTKAKFPKATPSTK